MPAKSRLSLTFTLWGAAAAREVQKGARGASRPGMMAPLATRANPAKVGLQPASRNAAERETAISGNRV